MSASGFVNYQIIKIKILDLVQISLTLLPHSQCNFYVSPSFWPDELPSLRKKNAALKQLIKEKDLVIHSQGETIKRLRAENASIGGGKKIE